MRIKIEGLQIRLRGVAPETARAAIGQLGGELMQQLAEQRRAVARSSTNLARLDAGAVHASAGTGSAELGRMIAERIARAIGEKLAR